MPAVRLYYMEIGGEIFFDRIPFSPEPTWAVGNQALFAGVGDHSEVSVWDPEGRLRMLIRRRERNIKLTREHVTAYRRAALAGDGNADIQPQLQRFFAAVPVPDRAPAFSMLLVDDLQHLWAEQYSLPGSVGSQWSIFSPVGRWLGNLSTPDGLELLDVGEDFLLGVHRDDLQVERVQLYRLDRGS